MELLYGLITILFFVTIILLMFFLFRSNQGTEKKPDVNSISIKKLLGGLSPKKTPDKANDEYQLVYGSPDSINETLCDTALEVVITNIHDKDVYVRAEIMKDSALSKDGVTIGRQGCSYNMKSLYIDKQGSFLLKLAGNTFHIYANLDSLNGLKTDYNGEKVMHVAFKEHQTIYVGPVSFSFSIPGYENTPNENTGNGVARFFTEETRRPDQTRTYNG